MVRQRFIVARVVMRVRRLVSSARDSPTLRPLLSRALILRPDFAIASSARNDLHEIAGPPLESGQSHVQNGSRRWPGPLPRFTTSGLTKSSRGIPAVFSRSLE